MILRDISCAPQKAPMEHLFRYEVWLAPECGVTRLHRDVPATACISSLLSAVAANSSGLVVGRNFYDPAAF
jgi:hypothetical protein